MFGDDDIECDDDDYLLTSSSPVGHQEEVEEQSHEHRHFRAKDNKVIIYAAVTVINSCCRLTKYAWSARF